METSNAVGHTLEPCFTPVLGLVLSITASYCQLLSTTVWHMMYTRYMRYMRYWNCCYFTSILICLIHINYNEICSCFVLFNSLLVQISVWNQMSSCVLQKAEQCADCTVYCSVCAVVDLCVRCTVYCVLCTVVCVWCTVYCVL